MRLVQRCCAEPTGEREFPRTGNDRGTEGETAWKLEGGLRGIVGGVEPRGGVVDLGMSRECGGNDGVLGRNPHFFHLDPTTHRWGSSREGGGIFRTARCLQVL